MLKNYSLLVFYFLFACNKPSNGLSQDEVMAQGLLTPASGGVSTNPEDPYNVDSLDGSVEDKSDLRNKLSIAERSYDSLYEFKILNTFLCLRLRLYREECLINNPIIPSGLETTLQCYESDASPSPVEHSYSVQLSSTSPLNTNLYLLADDVYQSNVFSTEATSLSFGSLSGTTTLAPSFKELESLVIKAENPGATLPSYSTISLNLLVDGTPIVSGAVLPSSNSAESTSEYRVNLKQVLDMSQSGVCSVTPSEISNISQKAKEYTETNKPNFSPFSAQEESLGVSDKTTVIETLISSSESELNVERTRYSDFISELQSTEKSGCKLSEPLNKLSIRLNGSITAQEAIKYNSTSPMTFSNQSSDCTSLNINLGSGLSYFVDQDSQTLLSSTAPEYLPPVYDMGLTLANINKIYLKRSGICIDNVQVAVGKTIWDSIVGSGVDYNYNVFEQKIFHITGISISANSLVVYDKQNLDITFDRDHELSWEDPLFEQNQKWIEMLQNEDCNLTK